LALLDFFDDNDFDDENAGLGCVQTSQLDAPESFSSVHTGHAHCLLNFGDDNDGDMVDDDTDNDNDDEDNDDDDDDVDVVDDDDDDDEGVDAADVQDVFGRIGSENDAEAIIVCVLAGPKNV